MATSFYNLIFLFSLEIVPVRRDSEELLLKRFLGMQASTAPPPLPSPWREKKNSALTNDAPDERVPALLDGHELAVLAATLAPTAHGHLGLQARVLALERGELGEAALLEVELRIQHEDLPGDVAHADERVDEVGAEIGGHVVDPILADARPVDRPVAEVADHAAWLLATCRAGFMFAGLEGLTCDWIEG